MKSPRFTLYWVALASTLICAPVSLAQNTGGVFGPVVNDGHQAVQYRATFDPDSEGFAQRLHFERAASGDLMWRVVVQTRKVSGSDFDFDFVQSELFWHLTRDDRPWQTGVRFDARIRGDGRPGVLGVNWTNQIRLAPQWQARALVLTAIELGDGARDGVSLQTRANLTYALRSKQGVGLELFSAYGTTSDLANFDEQRHQLGPFSTLPAGKSWSVFVGALFGLTSVAPDRELRVWLTRSF